MCLIKGRTRVKICHDLPELLGSSYRIQYLMILLACLCVTLLYLLNMLVVAFVRFPTIPWWRRCPFDGHGLLCRKKLWGKLALAWQARPDRNPASSVSDLLRLCCRFGVRCFLSLWTQANSNKEKYAGCKWPIILTYPKQQTKTITNTTLKYCLGSCFVCFVLGFLRLRNITGYAHSAEASGRRCIGCENRHPPPNPLPKPKATRRPPFVAGPGAVEAPPPPPLPPCPAPPLLLLFAKP